MVETFFISIEVTTFYNIGLKVIVEKRNKLKVVGVKLVALVSDLNLYIYICL